MLFNSFEFIFVFLPVTVAGYFILARSQWLPNAPTVWLGLASLAFYAYWDYWFLPVILVSIVVNFIFGIQIARLPAHTAARRVLFVAAVVANLLALGLYKYLDFGIDIVNGINGLDGLATTKIAHVSLPLPLGISFFTFTQLAYLFDVHYGYSRERSFSKYLLFVSYFPHLIAGPILHHKEMIPQFGSDAARRFSSLNLAIGLTVFVVGLFKKVVIADGFSLVANPVFADAAKGGIGTLDAWGGALAYSLQIYFDFSGYSDMAIGLSCMFGIKLPFNFDSPYKARSIVEFWRRWHITLSRFLRDYLYIPLGGNRGGVDRHRLNLLITMLLGGLWHGAAYTFVIWGGLHGIFLIVNHAWSRLKGRVPALSHFANMGIYGLASLLLTQLCVVLAWLYFRADSVGTANRILEAMIGIGGHENANTHVNWGRLGGIALGYLACFVLPNVNALFARWNIGLHTYQLSHPRTWPVVQWRPNGFLAVALCATFLICLLAIMVAGDGSQFLYFQF